MTEARGCGPNWWPQPFTEIGQQAGLIMLLIAVTLSAATLADRWVRVGGSTSLYEEYVDQESVRRSGDKVSLWTRRDYVGGSRTSWNELEFDCRMRTGAVLAFIEDDGGSVSHNVDRPHRAAAPVAPNSVEERLFNIACR